MIADGLGVVPSLWFTLADDASALLVRSGLVSTTALDEARAQIGENGGTLGEQLVIDGTVSDEALTDFYKTRLLVPQVNPNTLARLAAKVVAVIPSDMAIGLRAIPVSLDDANNLTVAMGDPSDRQAVDQIASFTGTYVVRACATQMQIAWCLAHYYGHVTPLGERLLAGRAGNDPQRVKAAKAAVARTKGLTGQVQAQRHRAIAPVTGPVDVQRPAEVVRDTEPIPVIPDDAPAPVEETDGTPQPRARSVSGEIRVPRARAASIKPAIEAVGDDESGPVISIFGEPSGPMRTLEPDSSGPVIEMIVGEPSGPAAAAAAAADVVASLAAEGEDTDQLRPAPPRRTRPAEPDPPELAARHGEVQIASGPTRAVDDEPRIVIAPDALQDRTSPVPNPEVSGEFRAIRHRDSEPPPSITIEVSDDVSAGVVIHEHRQVESVPILLDRKRPMTLDPDLLEDDPDDVVDQDDDDEVVVLEAKKPATGRPRLERRTQIGVAVATSPAGRAVRDTEATPEVGDADPTRVDTGVAPAPDDRTTSDEILAAPPGPILDDDTAPVGAISPAPPPIPMDRVVPRAPSDDDDDDDADDGDVRDRGKTTTVMSAIELDSVIPQRSTATTQLQRSVDYDPVDDGWGPPGTTIPPPLLGAIPGSIGGGSASGIIPVPDIDSAPLMIAPPAPPEAMRGAGASDATALGLVRALEEATARTLALIHALDQAETRDEVIELMIDHLAETHRRAGFFSIKGPSHGGELALFAMEPRPAVQPSISLRLDRPSTLQDVVGTRLPYRGPMHDDASRTFLGSVLGACPPEILLVPVAIRERVVGVLFGEHRMRHTFDDQLALAARAAGMALERALKSKRG